MVQRPPMMTICPLIIFYLFFPSFRRQIIWFDCVIQLSNNNFPIVAVLCNLRFNQLWTSTEQVIDLQYDPNLIQLLNVAAGNHTLGQNWIQMLGYNWFHWFYFVICGSAGTENYRKRERKTNPNAVFGNHLQLMIIQEKKHLDLLPICLNGLIPILSFWNRLTNL